MPGRSVGVVLALLGLAAAQASPSAAQAPEVIEIVSLTLTDHQFLQGDVAGGAPVTLTGKLQLPTHSEPAPLVILLHGSDGAGSAAGWSWANYLTGRGFATFRLDSYTGRGHSEIYTDQSRVGEFNNIYDTYRAVDVLAADPRIDPARIAVMGFSRGGIGALYSALARFQELYGPSGAGIAAHLPFYPPCNFELVGEMEIGAAPIRAFHGADDDWNPLLRCRDYIERLAAAGYDAEITVYPGALHSFDHPGSPAYNVVNEAQTSRACMRREQEAVLLNVDTGEPFSWTDACVQFGPSVHYNDAAATQAQAAVGEFLTALFRNQSP